MRSVWDVWLSWAIEHLHQYPYELRGIGRNGSYMGRDWNFQAKVIRIRRRWGVYESSSRGH